MRVQSVCQGVSIFMDDVVCRDCGTINDYRTEFKSGQQCAFCNSCGTYIKNIAYKPPMFYFGKYKGTEISTCSDLGYLQWFLSETKPKANIRKAVEFQIKKLEGENGV